MAALILLTGASGYIGSRLLRVLEEGGCEVRCLSRQPERVSAGRATTEIVAGDCLDESSLDAAMKGVGQAYYLVHSMASGSVFAARDRKAAANFGRAAARAGVRRIIYLGGLGADQDSLSTHLKSRLETGEALRAPALDPIACWRVERIGAEPVVRDDPRAGRAAARDDLPQVGRPTQPIAIDDVLAYLRAAIDLPEVGGPYSKSADPRWSPTAT
jgi:uncharacterized protein YbjT (DUF2867 family)